MKKALLLLAITFATVTHVNAQLLIISEVPTDIGALDSITVDFNEFYLNKNLSSQFSLYTVKDSVNVKAFVNGGEIGKRYNFQLDSVPTISVMWDSVKARLESEGLTVETVE